MRRNGDPVDHPRQVFELLNSLNAGAPIQPLINSLTGRDDVATNIQSLRESDEKFYLWDTKTTSFAITGTPTELDIFIAASVDPDFGDNVHVNAVLDSIATGIGSQAQNAVLSKSPGALRVEFTDPIFSIEMGPAGLTASSGDTLDFNDQGSYRANQKLMVWMLR